MIEFEKIPSVIEIRQRQAGLKAEAAKISKALSSIKQRESDVRQDYYSVNGELTQRRSEYLARFYMSEIPISQVRKLETRRESLSRELNDELPLAQHWLEAKLQELDAEQKKCKDDIAKVEKQIQKYEIQKTRCKLSPRYYNTGIDPGQEGGRLNSPEAERSQLVSLARELDVDDDCDTFLKTLGG